MEVDRGRLGWYGVATPSPPVLDPTIKKSNRLAEVQSPGDNGVAVEEAFVWSGMVVWLKHKKYGPIFKVTEKGCFGAEYARNDGESAGRVAE